MNSQRIEQFKAQSNLIVQAVGTGDQKSACRNLISFIRLGLLEDPQGRLGKCETDLNAIPVLPSGSTYTPVLDAPAAVAMAPVVNTVMQGDNYHYDVSFTVPPLSGLLAGNPVSLVSSRRTNSRTGQILHSCNIDGDGRLNFQTVPLFQTR